MFTDSQFFFLYIASDHKTELKSTSESSDGDKTYEITDGNIITVRAGRFRCAESTTHLSRAL